MDYAVIFMSGYSERHSTANLWISPENFESLRSQLGLSANWTPGADLSLEARALWYLELMDKRAELRVRDAAGLGIEQTFRGERQGASTLGLGAGLSWKPVGNFAFSLDDEFLLAERYRGHQAGLALKLSF